MDAGVDVGGTFTDVVAVSDDGPAVVRKVPTTGDDQGRGVADGLSSVTGNFRGRVAHGTTTATNAVLERDVARTILITTEGFADVLSIARQDRPSLYDLSVTKPEHLTAGVVTAAERIDVTGATVVALTDAEVKRIVGAVTDLQPGAVAVSLLGAFANSGHEDQLAAALTEQLSVPVSTSGDLVGEFREYERTSTVVLNAAVSPVMSRYLRRLERRLPRSSVRVMTSAGGTASLERAATAPVQTLLSGPAAGVVAAAAVARAAGFSHAVTFDMGGTSTDVCLISDGQPQLDAASAIGGLPFRTPAVAVHTVGAGGGSLAWVDAGGALRVGPRSAGAHPGPACYGMGGTEPTVTDAHAALGHLAPSGSLGTAGPHLDLEAASTAITTLPEGIAGPDGAAQGVITVAQATMVRALRRVTTEQGVDPAGLALVAYGGAGPLHATALGRQLGARAVIIPPTPGVLSALGLLLAPPRSEAARTVMTRVKVGTEPAATLASLEPLWEDLTRQAADALTAQGITDPTISRVADCRYAGQAHELRIPFSAQIIDDFHAAHRDAYSYDLPSEPVDIVTIRAVAEGTPALGALPTALAQETAPRAPSRRPVHIGGREFSAEVLDRAALPSGTEVSGPAVIEQADATALLGPDDTAQVDPVGNLIVQLDGSKTGNRR